MVDLDLFGKTPRELIAIVAENEKKYRKQKGYTQKELARRAGVSYASLCRFEQTGEISIHGLAKLACVLEAEEQFAKLFEPKQFTSMKELLNENGRKG